jgi:hypothetical protein
MRHKDNELAAIGTMRPESITKMLYWTWISFVGRSIRTISWPELQVWEASSGPNCSAAVSAGTPDGALFSCDLNLKLASGALLLDGCERKQVQCGREPSDGRAEVEP